MKQLLTVGLLVALTGCWGCSRKTPEPVAAVVAPPTKAAAAQAPAVGADGKLDPNDPKHGSRKLMGLDAPVYVDGTQIAIMRFGEMPSIPAIELEGGGRRYKIYDYLKSIGVDPQTIKSVHFHGNGDRIASIEGSELRREKDRFKFSFISGNTGTPLQKWDTERLKNEFVIHEIRRMTIYVKKPAPAIDPHRQCHVGADGECTEAIPYATGEIAKGTRVYLDGKMVGFVKRRQMGDGLIVSGSPQTNGNGGDDTRYSVAKLVAQMGVDPSGVKTLELVAGDDIVARATGDQFKQLDTQTYFTLPPHNHGKVRIHVPAEMQAKEPGSTDRDALVSSVLLYKDTTPANRELVTISEDTDLSVQLAAIDDARAKLGRREQ